MLDGPTDVRGIYVPMTRGRHRNDAYVVITGEQAALDVFAESISRSWIDQPAHARQARTQLDQAKAGLGAAAGRLQNAFDTVARLDRPVRRRGNEANIADAKHTIDRLPDKMREQAASVRDLSERLDKTDQHLSRGEQRAQRKPSLEAHLQAVTSRLDDDRSIRIRQIHRNPPSTITDEVGARPTNRNHADRWDVAAARLDQHHAAYDVTIGISATKYAKLPGFKHSRALAKQDQHLLDHGIALERQQARQREGPVLRIGR